MAKRQAATELNHDNWDQEEPDDAEEKGTFSSASKDVLETRVIKVAKRRTTQSDNSKSVFNQFGGFNKSQKTSFDFLANLAKTSTPIAASSSVSNSNTTSNLFTSKPVATSTDKVPTVFSTIPNFGSHSPPSSVFTLPKDTSTSVNVSFTLPSTSVAKKDIEKTETSKENNLFSIPFSQSSSNIFGASNNGANTSIFSSSSSSNLFQTLTTPNKVALNETQIKVNNKDEETKHNTKNIYYSKLKKLNTTVLQWIRKHVEDTPICILTPIFKDYENYVNEIINEYKNDNSKINFVSCNQQDKVAEKETPLLSNTSESGKAVSLLSNETKSVTSETPFSNTFTSSSLFSNKMSEKLTNQTLPDNNVVASSESFNSLFKPPLQTSFPKTNLEPITNTDNTPKSFTFTSQPFQSAAITSADIPVFSSTTISPFTSSPSIFSSQNTSTTPQFSFGTGGQFSFLSNVQKTSDAKEQDDDNEDEPPKVEFTPIAEENNVYDKRCKIFIRKDGQYVDNGVCTLYIKKTAESNKHQLLVRANTSLGTIMLNLILTSSLPIQKMGKNNVMLVCIPKPEMEPPPIPILIKVKTSEEADDLLETLNKYKN